MITNETRAFAKPILKWVGGKRQLLPELTKRLPPAFKRYLEPFFGGGALFFELHNLSLLNTAFISDKNRSLIEVYTAIRDNPIEVIEVLRKYKYSEKTYYKIRELQIESLSLPEKAARLLYLNKTGFNGLYRENSKGKFNVPFGKHKNPNICDTENLLKCSSVLKNAEISCADFPDVLAFAAKGDFVYFDPPYIPLSKTSNFTSYGKDGFFEHNHVRLMEVYSELDRFGCYVMLSNSDTEFTNKLYSKFNISKVFASRLVNSKSTARGKIQEIIVTNY